MKVRFTPAVLLLVTIGCGVAVTSQPDAGSPMDAGSLVDAGLEADAGDTVDAGDPVVTDAGVDGGATTIDGGVDAGPVDAGEPDAGPPDGGPPDAGPPDAGSCPNSTPTCHSLTQVASLVDEARVAEEPPVPMGGTITPGLYMLVSSTIYTGIGGMSGQTGVLWTTVRVNQNDGGLSVDILNTQLDCGEQRQSLGLTTTETDIVMTPLCPADCEECGGTAPYTATETTLSIFRFDTEGTTVQTFQLL